MAVPMMDVGIVRVAVADRQMAVRMAVRFAAIPGEVVFVLVMQVMAVAMAVLDFLVGVGVLVAFRQVQPDAERHQCRGQPE